MAVSTNLKGPEGALVVLRYAFTIGSALEQGGFDDTLMRAGMDLALVRDAPNAGRVTQKMEQGATAVGRAATGSARCKDMAQRHGAKAWRKGMALGDVALVCKLGGEPGVSP